MAHQLLIRVYDVGLGDCIYVRIPGEGGANKDAFHLLIDCGTWSSEKLLSIALDNLASELPVAEDGQRKRLDLVVVTHEHKDHIGGFDPKLWTTFDVGKVWMNCAMNPRHPDAGKTRKVRKLAEQGMASLAALAPWLNPRVAELISVFEIGNAGAIKTLRHALLAEGQEPDYVFAGQSNADLGIELHPEAAIEILAPEFEFDRFYLGQAAQTALKGIIGAAAFEAVDDEAAEDPAILPATTADTLPTNVGPATFRALRARMQSKALAFAELDSKLKNNSSVVLLITWKGKRLLFVGDAEWHGRVKPQKMNGSWNVMWQERKTLLGKPVDFLKIGHHGSENATPWDMGSGYRTEEADILDAILPLPKTGQKPTARAVVSTERGKYPTIPRCLLLVEIARRIDGATSYFADVDVTDASESESFKRFERDWLTSRQPRRTDFERSRGALGYIDTIFK